MIGLQPWKCCPQFVSSAGRSVVSLCWVFKIYVERWFIPQIATIQSVVTKSCFLPFVYGRVNFCACSCIKHVACKSYASKLLNACMSKGRKKFKSPETSISGHRRILWNLYENVCAKSNALRQVAVLKKQSLVLKLLCPSLSHPPPHPQTGSCITW